MSLENSTYGTETHFVRPAQCFFFFFIFVKSRLVRLYQAAIYRQDVHTFIYTLWYGKVCLWLWEICLEEDLVGRACSSQQHQDLRGRLLNKGCLLNPQGSQCDVALDQNLLHFSSSFLIALHFLDKFLYRSILLCLLNNTYGSNEWAMDRRRRGISNRDPKSLNMHGPFVLRNAKVNCNAFTAANSLNRPYIRGHHYSVEPHRFPWL